MPRVLFDRVVSFSSEDPAHPASNLVTGAGRWVCEPDAGTCSVVLALSRSSRLFSVQVGALGVALVEVLVGRSETPDQYQVLVASSVFLSPAESRRAAAEVVGGGVAGERVRSFTHNQMCATVRDQPWDILRVVCSQPYIRKPKVGLAFMHVFEEESLPPRVCVSPVPLVESPQYRPGDLFRNFQSPTTPNNTYGQIRRADADIMRGVTGVAGVDTPPRPAPQQQYNRPKRDTLYSDREDRGGRRNEDVACADVSTGASDCADGGGRGRRHKRKREDKGSDRRRNEPPTSARRDVSEVLRGVVFDMSGYENPERAELRAAGVLMGGVYCPRGGATCTHLICAFPNTPKLRTLRKEEKKRGVSPAAGVPAVTGEWVLRCRAARRRLPCSWFAVEPALRTAEHPLSEHDDGDSSERDTDDEIEDVLRLDTEDEDSPPVRPPASPRYLPDLFRGRGVHISSDVITAGFDAALLTRYVRAYGGRVASSVDDDVCVVLKAGAEGVRADWLWACHDRGVLLPTEPYSTDY